MTHTTQSDLQSLRVGYVPISKSLQSPGDKRRFPYYAAKRNLDFEIANPSNEYDILILTQNADLSLWSHSVNRKTKIIYDLIDSYLAIPKYNIKGLFRGLAKYLSGQSRYLRLNHWKAITDMCSRADAVICSTQEQFNTISNFADNVHIILDFHMGVARLSKKNYVSSKPFRIVWEGLPQNLSSLNLLRPTLKRLANHHSIEIHIVTDSTYKRFLGKYASTDSLQVARRIIPDVCFHEWQQSNFADVICSCDLAVIPLDLRNNFAAGKPENKLLLFWRMAMPVVASATPAYCRSMNAAGLNNIATTESDWYDILSSLISDQALRERSGLLGKEYVDSEFSEAQLLNRWDTLFQSLDLQPTIQRS